MVTGLIRLRPLLRLRSLVRLGRALASVLSEIVCTTRSTEDKARGDVCRMVHVGECRLGMEWPM